MRKTIALFLCGVFFSVAQAAPIQTAWTTEILVLNATATLMRTHSSGRAFEIQNLGPNDIWCSFSSTITIGKVRKVAANGGTWALDSAQVTSQVWCKAGTADQVTGAATIVSEAAAP